MIIGTVMDVMI